MDFEPQWNELRGKTPQFRQSKLLLWGGGVAVGGAVSSAVAWGVDGGAAVVA